MVKWLATILGGLDKDAQVVDNGLLTVEVVEAKRPEGILKVLLFLVHLLIAYIEIVCHGLSKRLFLAKLRLFGENHVLFTE